MGLIVWNTTQGVFVNGPHASEDEAEAAVNRLMRNQATQDVQTPDYRIVEVPDGA